MDENEKNKKDLTQNKTFLLNTSTQAIAKDIDRKLGFCQSFDVLVGFFYFSGIKEIYKNLGDKPTRILVGLDMERDLLEHTAEAHTVSNANPNASQAEQRDNFFASIVKLFNERGFCENAEEQEAFKVYYNKIKDGTLEIHKTKDPCHAKMYIFTNDTEKQDLAGSVIMGSSNLSYNGLKSNCEINAVFNDKDELEEAQAVFNTLWAESTVLVDKDTVALLDGALKHTWYETLPTPYLLYLRALYEYFHLDDSKAILSPNEITQGLYDNLKYQEDAVRLALQAIKQHKGVIVADVVGLGKSIVGAAVARNLDLPTVIIAPPHLVGQWEGYAQTFQLRGPMVRSRGNMEKAYQDYTNTYARQKTPCLIIVDEAHIYRNEYRIDYSYLHEMCHANNNRVLLLTATPFNNRPEDIYSLIKLFQIPGHSTLHTAMGTLGSTFANLIERNKEIIKRYRKNEIDEKEYQRQVANIGLEIRNLIDPVVIRRSRLDLMQIPSYKQDLEYKHYAFPEVLPPQAKEYDLGDLSELYLYTLQHISRHRTKEEEGLNHGDDFKSYVREAIDKGVFTAARYQPLSFYAAEHYDDLVKLLKAQGMDEDLFFNAQSNLADFMRRLLVSRFESSQKAFLISLDRMIHYHQNILNWMEQRNAVPIFKKGDLPEVIVSDNDEIEEDEEQTKLEGKIETLSAKGLFEVKLEWLDGLFKQAVESDLKVLQDLQQRWALVTNPEDEANYIEDPKVKGFVEHLQKMRAEDPKRKIVVFSQFADTVYYLKDKLEAAGLPIFAYSAQDATIANKNTIIANFDASLSPENQKDDYQILIATDAISEGYNLHRAGTIFNFDIPYNPTRVIQRVGRINRINKKMFDQLYIYNYFPTEIGEKDVQVQAITHIKMTMLQIIIGDDTQYLTEDETPNNYFVKRYNESVQSSEAESWDTPYRKLLEAPEVQADLQKALALPLRSKVHRLLPKPASIEEKDQLEAGTLAVARQADDIVFPYWPIKQEKGQKVQYLPAPTAFQYLQALADERPFKLSNTSWAALEGLNKHLIPALARTQPSSKKGKDALEKIRLFKTQNLLGKEYESYLEHLDQVIQYEALSLGTLRRINQLTPKQANQLLEIATPESVENLLNDIQESAAKTTLLLAEHLDDMRIPDSPELEL